MLKVFLYERKNIIKERPYGGDSEDKLFSAKVERYKKQRIHK